MLISDDNFSRQADISPLNEYQFHEVPFGAYSIIPSGNNPSYTYRFFPDRMTVTIDEAYEMLPPVLGVALRPEERAVAGLILDSSGKPVNDVYVQLVNDGAVIGTYDSRKSDGVGSYVIKILEPEVTDCELIVRNGYSRNG